MSDTQPPVPDESEAPTAEERVPGLQGGTTPEHHGGVYAGSDAAGDYVDGQRSDGQGGDGPAGSEPAAPGVTD